MQEIWFRDILIKKDRNIPWKGYVASSLGAEFCPVSVYLFNLFDEVYVRRIKRNSFLDYRQTKLSTSHISPTEPQSAGISLTYNLTFPHQFPYKYFKNV